MLILDDSDPVFISNWSSLDENASKMILHHNRIFTEYMYYFMLELVNFFLAQLFLLLVQLWEVFIMQTLIQSSVKMSRILFHILHHFLTLSLGKVSHNQNLLQRKHLLEFR